MKNQPTIVAVVGKGGVGKTALSAALARIAIEKRVHPLLIDADPAQGLTYLLDRGPQDKTIGTVRDKIIGMARAEGRDAKEEIAARFDYLLAEALIEPDGFSLLAMGRSHSRGCFCPLNNLLRQAIESLSGNFPFVLIDAEAGIEQINREVIRGVSHLLVLTDPSRRSITVAGKIRETLSELGLDCRVGSVANRAGGGENGIREAFREAGLELWAVIGEDPPLRENDRAGRSIFTLSENSDMLRAAREIFSRLENR